MTKRINAYIQARNNGLYILNKKSQNSRFIPYSQIVSIEIKHHSLDYWVSIVDANGTSIRCSDVYYDFNVTESELGSILDRIDGQDTEII